MRAPSVICFSVAAQFMLAVPQVQAGMTVYGLNEVYRIRTQELSFFLVLLLVCTILFKLLWNVVARDVSWLPRLGWRQASCLSLLLGVGMLLILTMISGIREVLTPEAWRKQGTAYRLNSTEQETVRKRAIEELRFALFAHAKTNGGNFPAHDFTSDLPARFWEAPDRKGSRYVYFGRRQLSPENSSTGVKLLAMEPPNFGEQRFVIMTNGEIKKIGLNEIRLLDQRE